MNNLSCHQQDKCERCDDYCSRRDGKADRNGYKNEPKPTRPPRPTINPNGEFVFCVL